MYISTADRPKDGGSEHANSENSDGEFPDIEVGESVEQGGYTIERLPDAETEHIAAPSLNRKLVRPNNMEVAVFAQIESNIAETIAVLKIEDNFNAWMNLASLYTIAEDYKGSEEVLVYLSKKYTPSWQVFANLGSLYGTFLGDLNSAVTNYQKAIELLPQNASLYRSLHEVYVALGNQDKAVSILKEGIIAEPRAIDLYVVLARYLKSIGKLTEATAQYDAAINQANNLGNAELAAQIEAERNQ